MEIGSDRKGNSEKYNVFLYESMTHPSLEYYMQATGESPEEGDKDDQECSIVCR